MLFAETLQMRIKPLKYDSDDEFGAASSPPSPVSDKHGSSNDSEIEVGPLDISDEESLQGEQEIGTITFGALARAQQTFGKHKQMATEDTALAPYNSHIKTRPYTDAEAQEREAGRNDTREFSRSSKHAPVEQSSKKAASRRREVVPTKSLDHRDPRFEPTGGRVDESRTKKNYSFLDEYRESEMTELRTAIRQTKDPGAKEKLKQTLQSMESRKKTQEARNQQQELVRIHRAKEKELVRQGKKPFYLKRAEQKKLALVKRFAGLKGKQVDRVIERRRKKRASRMRKEMPHVRRCSDGVL